MQKQGVENVMSDESLNTPAESHLTSATSLVASPLDGALTPASSTFDDTGTCPQDVTKVDETTTNTQHATAPLTEQSDVKPAEAQMRPDMRVVRLIEEADHSAGKLVNLLAKHFPCFRDEGRFDGRKVRFLKRAQIFVADLWAAFNGTGYGEFYDIDHITMFAGQSSLVEPKSCTSGNSDTSVLDYRVPQMLYNLGVITFSPPLESRIRKLEELKTGESWEMQLRGCSIWAVEMIRRQIVQEHPESKGEVNAVLLDFLLYDLAKEFESTGTFCACGVFSCAFPLDRLQKWRPMSAEDGRLHKHRRLRRDPTFPCQCIPELIRKRRYRDDCSSQDTERLVLATCENV